MSESNESEHLTVFGILVLTRREQREHEEHLIVLLKWILFCTGILAGLAIASLIVGLLTLAWLFRDVPSPI